MKEILLSTVSFVASIILVFSLICISPPSASAYALGPGKMDRQIWFRCSTAFTAETRELFRQMMATWNAYLPEYRRVCYNTTTHSMTTFPYRDNLSCIYKVGVDKDYAGISQITYASGMVREADININAKAAWQNNPAPGYYW